MIENHRKLSWFLSQYLIILSYTGDQHQPTICQSPHLKSWVYIIEGPLQRNNQVTGQMKTSILPFNLFHCNIPVAELAPPYRKEDVRATEKDKVCLRFFCLFFCSSKLFNKDWFLLKVEIYKSFRPGDIVLAKVVSLTCYRIYNTKCNAVGGKSIRRHFFFFFFKEINLFWD